MRTNLGAQYSVVTPSGWYANVLFGESDPDRRRQLVPPRRHRQCRASIPASTRRASDFVGRFQLSPNQNITFITRGRFDHAGFRGEPLRDRRDRPPRTLRCRSISRLFYSYYEAQPALGFANRREGISASATYHVTPNWFVTGSALVDLTHYLDVRDTFQTRLRRLPREPGRDGADLPQRRAASICRA